MKNNPHSNRHPSTQHMLKMLIPNPNLTGEAEEISQSFYSTADALVFILEDSPELTAGLRKLLEAKDCFIRAAILQDPVDYRDR